MERAARAPEVMKIALIPGPHARTAGRPARISLLARLLLALLASDLHEVGHALALSARQSKSREVLCSQMSALSGCDVLSRVCLHAHTPPQDVVPTLDRHLRSLERCAASLNEFLLTRRAQCPRLFFLADDELLVGSRPRISSSSVLVLLPWPDGVTGNCTTKAGKRRNPHPNMHNARHSP